jgi:hypothetical protein
MGEREPRASQRALDASKRLRWPLRLLCRKMTYDRGYESRLHGSASASPASSSSPSPSSSLSLSAASTRCLPFLLHHLVRIHGCVVPVYQAGTQEMMRRRPFSSAAPKFLTPSPCFCRRRPPTSCWRRCFGGRGIAAPGPRFT